MIRPVDCKANTSSHHPGARSPRDPGVNTFEVSSVDFSLLGHAAYAESQPVLYDMGRLLRLNMSPQQRQRMRAVGACTLSPDAICLRRFRLLILPGAMFSSAHKIPLMT